MLTDKKTQKRYREIKCPHLNTQPTAYTNAQGGRCVYIQCPDCGGIVDNVRKTGYNFDKLPLFDDYFRQAQKEARREIYLRIWDEEREKEL